MADQQNISIAESIKDMTGQVLMTAPNLSFSASDLEQSLTLVCCYSAMSFLAID